MTPSKYVKINPAGRIVERLSALPSDASLNTRVGEVGWFIAAGDPDADHYWFDDGQLAKRPVLTKRKPGIKANGRDSFKLTVPSDGEAVYLKGEERIAVDISDGAFEFQTTVPGEYRFEFDCFPFRKQTVTVIASAVPD